MKPTWSTHAAVLGRWAAAGLAKAGTPLIRYVAQKRATLQSITRSKPRRNP